MSERIRHLPFVAPLLLLLLLAGAWLVPAGGGLRLGGGDRAEVDRWADALDALPGEPLVLVGFDPDLGTYAEIRPTVRVLLADLLNRDARLALVSMTPEGRALALSELDRLSRRQANATRLLDLGFVPGAEAALVSLTRSLPVGGREGSIARRLADGGMESVDAAVVIGGNDLGPRSWVEQVAPRTDGLPLLAVAPTVLLPELRPYMASGQLDALLATPGDGAAYRARVELGPLDRLADSTEPPPLAILVGLALALLVLGQALMTRLGDAGGGAPAGDHA